MLKFDKEIQEEQIDHEHIITLPNQTQATIEPLDQKLPPNEDDDGKKKNIYDDSDGLEELSNEECNKRQPTQQPIEEEDTLD